MPNPGPRRSTTGVRPDGWQELSGHALRTRAPWQYDDDAASAFDCDRWRAAPAGGARFGCFVPVLEGDRVVALYEFYSRDALPFFGGRSEKWRAIARVAAHARRRALDRMELQAMLHDREAVTKVVTTVGAATTQGAALRAALETVREEFGWAYGSYWALDEVSDTLKFVQESGTAGAEFHEVTLRASFAEGVGLSGRAWRSRDLVYVRDLAQMTDCVRAPAAQRAGVKSGVCFPITFEGRVVGTMDFFATDVMALSDSRAAALRNVQQLVSQRLEVLRRGEAEAEVSQALLETVSRLREAVLDAGRVAEAAVGQVGTMRDEVAALQEASTAVGDVIKVITAIAGQTNLLALNATVEAARAGELGRGFAVVAGEVKDLARETAEATQRVFDQVGGVQASSAAVTEGITATASIIEELDEVQARIGEVIAEQVQMAAAHLSWRRSVAR